MMKLLPLVAGVLSCFCSPALALEPTKVRAEICNASLSSTDAMSWSVSAPSTVDPNTPRLDVVLTSPSALPSPASGLSFSLHGSLGLPDHPLGVFGFKANGSACGTQTAYVMNGVLGQVILTFPHACDSPFDSEHARPAADADADAGTSINVHVDVWTVLPVIPPLLSTGFEFDLTMSSTSNDELLCLKLDLAQPPGTGAEKSQDTCLMNDTSKAAPPPYPPTDPAMQLPTVTVDLDLPASERWKDVVVPRKEGINDLIVTFTDLIMKKNGTARKLVELLLNGAAVSEMKRMPKDFAEEIEGIALHTGIGVGSLWVLNMMYEVIGSCTSFIAQDGDGAIWHGRNLDFGLFMGTDAEKHTWLITEKLRKILVNVQFMKGGKVFYNSTTYAGFIGLLSGSKSDAFSITVNTRYDQTLNAGLIGWFLGMNDDCQFLTFQTRMAMEDNETYSDALTSLVDYKPLGPAYIIIGGLKPNEGAVIAKAFNSTDEIHGYPLPNHDVWYMNESITKGSFYVAETNYDRKKAPPSFDDRRYPMEDCLDKTGAEGVNAETIWKILSSNPTFNGLTTFSTIMSAGKGHFEAYLQHCDPGPTCVPF